MTKVELIEYENGHYGVRKTTGLIWKTYKYFDKGSNVWRAPGDDYFNRCFTNRLNEAQEAYVLTGLAPGASSVINKVISLDDASGMNKLAHTDPGMKDLLEKAKEYYYLKAK